MAILFQIYYSFVIKKSNVVTCQLVECPSFLSAKRQPPPVPLLFTQYPNLNGVKEPRSKFPKDRMLIGHS